MTVDPYGLRWRASEFPLTLRRMNRGDWLARLGVIGAALWLMGAWIS